MYKLRRFSDQTPGQQGFTIVELLIVVVVIAILAAITIVAYSGISSQSSAVALKTDVQNTQTVIDRAYVETGVYPIDATHFPASNDTVYEYDRTESTYCLTASSARAKKNYYIDTTTRQITEGMCSGHLGYAAHEGQNSQEVACVDRVYATLDAASFTTWATAKPAATCRKLDLWFYKQGEDPSTAQKRGELKIISGSLSGDGRTVTLTFQADKLGVWESGKTYSGSSYGGGIFDPYCPYVSGSPGTSHLTATHFASVGSPSGYAWGQVKTVSWACTTGRTPVIFGYSGGASQTTVGVVWGPTGIFN